VLEADLGSWYLVSYIYVSLGHPLFVSLAVATHKDAHEPAGESVLSPLLPSAEHELFKRVAAKFPADCEIDPAALELDASKLLGQGRASLVYMGLLHGRHVAIKQPSSHCVSDVVIEAAFHEAQLSQAMVASGHASRLIQCFGVSWATQLLVAWRGVVAWRRGVA
jgi:hypothetical protein